MHFILATLFFSTIAVSAHAEHGSNYQEELYFSLSSKALAAAKTAAVHISKNTPESIQKGIHLLESILLDESFKRLSINEKATIYLSLAKAYEQQKAYTKEENLLRELLENPHFMSYTVTLKVNLIRCYLLKGWLDSADPILMSLMQIPPQQYTSKEREEIAYVLEWFSRSYEREVRQARFLILKGSYDNAIRLLEDASSALAKKSFPLSTSEQVRCEYAARIGYNRSLAYFLKNDFSTASHMLASRDPAQFTGSDEMQALYDEGTYLLGLAYQKQQMPQQAMLAYNAYILRGGASAHYYDALYRTGYLQFAHGDYAQSRQTLLPITEIKHSMTLPAELLLAHIAIIDEQLEEARKRLFRIRANSHGASHNAYLLEALYLEGLILIKEGNLEKGALIIEQAIAQQQSSPADTLKAPWTNEAPFALANAYCTLAKSTLLQSQEMYSFMNSPMTNTPGSHSPIVATYLDRAASLLDKMAPCDMAPEKRSALASVLAQIALLRWQNTQEESLKAAVASLQKSDIDPDTYIELTLVQLAMSPKYAEKQALFGRMEQRSFSPTPLFTWYLFYKASTQLQEALALFALNRPKEASHVLKDGMETTAHLMKTVLRDDKNECTYLSDLASLLYFINDEAATALANTICTSISAADADFQTYALIMAALQNSDSEEQILQFVTDCPQSPYVPSLLHALATIYVQRSDYVNAEEVIRLLQYSFPDYEREDHLLYLLAQCLDAAPQHIEDARATRKELLNAYPESLYAAESHYRYFPEVEYELATPHAIAHLAQMAQRFKNSPFTIIACYYHGMYELREGNKKQVPEACVHYQAAAQSFSQAAKFHTRLLEEGLVPSIYKSTLSRYARMSSLHEAKALLAISKRDVPSRAQLECVKEILKHINMTTPKEDALSCSLVVESQYRLAQAYELLHDDDQAVKEMKLLIKGSAKDHNVFYIKAKIALGQQAIKRSHFERALKYLNELDKEKLPITFPELYLKVLIEKSNCYKMMQKYDRAMMLLSQVINNNLASSLRIKAMVLRSEIYDLQKRHDLALKQLEAAAKHGGEWGNVAKRKLEKIYGYD